MLDDFPIRLRRIRLSLSMQQEQVAQKIGVTKSTISTYENNARQPSLEMLVRLARLYNVSTDYLLGITDTVTIELTGLTDEDIGLVLTLVTLMAKKNEELNNRKIIDPGYAWVIPSGGDDKPVKVAFEGTLHMRERENEDWSRDVQLYQKVGVGVIMTNNLCSYVDTQLKGKLTW